MAILTEQIIKKILAGEIQLSALQLSFEETKQAVKEIEEYKTSSNITSENCDKTSQQFLVEQNNNDNDTTPGLTSWSPAF